MLSENKHPVVTLFSKQQVADMRHFCSGSNENIRSILGGRPYIQSGSILQQQPIVSKTLKSSNSILTPHVSLANWGSRSWAAEVTQNRVHATAACTCDSQYVCHDHTQAEISFFVKYIVCRFVEHLFLSLRLPLCFNTVITVVVCFFQFVVYGSYGCFYFFL